MIIHRRLKSANSVRYGLTSTPSPHAGDGAEGRVEVIQIIGACVSVYRLDGARRGGLCAGSFEPSLIGPRSRLISSFFFALFSLLMTLLHRGASPALSTCAKHL